MRQTYILNVKYGIYDALSAYFIVRQKILGRGSFKVKFFAMLLHNACTKVGCSEPSKVKVTL
jgi:hypothetical protein